MTRFVFFFVVSLAAHAAALVYSDSVPFAGKNRVSVIPVTILTTVQGEPQESGVRGIGKVAENSASPAVSKPTSRIKVAKPKTEPNWPVAPRPPAIPTAEVERANRTQQPLRSASHVTLERDATTPTELASDGEHGTGLEASGTDTGAGSSPAPAVSSDGHGSGNESGPAGTGIAVVQARYRETPRPDYPESARRQGREGRVLLRVLVDDQGRSKKVEINSSSGSEALDRAAAEAIQRWRFHPARYGGKPVESWIRVPIEFRLAETTR